MKRRWTWVVLVVALVAYTGLHARTGQTLKDKGESRIQLRVKLIDAET